jgi:hypothetical protein
MLAPGALLLFSLLGADPHLEAGEQALQAFDYERADTELQQARTAPDLSRGELLRLLEHVGEVDAILGRTDQAVAVFRELINLDPDHSAPDAWAPKVKTPFFEAKGWAASHPPLKLRAGDPTVHSGQVTALTFDVTDPLGLVRAIRVYVQRAEVPIRAPLEGSPPLSVPVPPQGQIHYWAEALDEHGAALVQLGSPDHFEQTRDVSPPPAVATPAPRAPGTSSLRLAGYAVAGGGAVLVAVGAVFGAMAQSDINTVSNAKRDAEGRITSVTRAQAISLNSQEKTNATLANLLFATGGVAIATGAGLWLGSVFVTAAPEPGGAAVALAIRSP